MWSLLVAVLGSATACSPRYSIHEVRATNFTPEPDAYVFEDSALVIAYDFWSFGGEPYVSFLNQTDDTLLLDLSASEVDAGFGRETLARLMGGGTAYALDIAYNYPELRLTPDGRAVMLFPRRWHSVYGMAQMPQRRYGGHHKPNRSVYTLEVYSRTERRTYTHVFVDELTERMSRKTFERFERTGAGGNAYYFDRGPRRTRAGMTVVLTIINLIAFL